jgi:hypothetical protein
LSWRSPRRKASTITLILCMQGQGRIFPKRNCALFQLQPTTTHS